MAGFENLGDLIRRDPCQPRLSAFRRAGLIETNERLLTILDLPGLRRIIDMR
jgi:hypothetical protein